MPSPARKWDSQFKGLRALLPLVMLALLLVTCEKVLLVEDLGEPGLDVISPGWLIPVREVFDGGPGKDGIPAIDKPQLVASSEVDFLGDRDLVIGVVIGGVARAYPHIILDWHEIINDQVGGESYSVTYCPLTGSGIGWDRQLSAKATTFGVSGKLYNSNLIPYDRETDSYWSQMKLQCVFGPNKGRLPGLVPIVETTWETWRAMYPNSSVVSLNTGFSRPYGRYPYGSFRTAEYLIFPVNPLDDRLPMKERVGGLIVEGQARAYQLSNFGAGVGVINDTFSDLPVVVAASEPDNFMVIFERTVGGSVQLNFNALQGQLPAVMQDDEGTIWDLFGRGLAGPRAGEQLAVTASFIAYWFAWGAFYPDLEIYSP